MSLKARSLSLPLSLRPHPPFPHWEIALPAKYDGDNDDDVCENAGYLQTRLPV